MYPTLDAIDVLEVDGVAMDIADMTEDDLLCCGVVPSDGTRYRLREAIDLQDALGRPLTDEELEAFRIA